MRVLLAYLVAVVLHGPRDGLPGLLANVVSNGIEIFIAHLLVGVTGVVILWRLWRGAEKRQAAREIPAAAPQSNRTEEKGT